MNKLKMTYFEKEDILHLILLRILKCLESQKNDGYIDTCTIGVSLASFYGVL